MPDFYVGPRRDYSNMYDERRQHVSYMNGYPGYEPIDITAMIKEVIYNNPATIVVWADGTKTIVKCSEHDTYSKETGLALCFMKYYLGNNNDFHKFLKKYCQGDK